ncbi:MAG: ATP-binding protein, partial [Desulfobacterales bacterium]|nr:ATP-binding protein [Desulfobacterales bacterium]
MNALMSLSPEWKRIDLLCTFIRKTRQGAKIGDRQKQLLVTLQQQVAAVRKTLPWEKLIHSHGLTDLDQDIIACVIAPEASARVGWLYQEFQPGIASPYPTPALIQELLFLDENDARFLHERLQVHTPLQQSGLLADTRAGYYQPLHPSHKARKRLLGRSAPLSFNPPGTIKIKPDGKWKDLVLPRYCLEKLKEFLLWITHKSYVTQQWGARIHGGPVALFTGPSGTGKTFATEAIANEIGWPLYRVDLGLVVSKYIGETEKNLNA